MQPYHSSPARRKSRSPRRGFTLIEIMIVTLIIGILLAVAVPEFMQAGRKSQAAACVHNLKQLHGAKERWAMGFNQTVPPTMPDLVSTYLRTVPVCPSGGTYTIGDMNDVPTCSIGGTAGDPEAHLLP
jgi:prepilin-type N-terminal cleavage/methylation domain-containing protein